MEALNLTHRDLASKPRRFAGQLVTLSGLLMVVDKWSCLILDPERSKIEVAIDDPGFGDRMLADLGCKVGEDYLYRDTASLQGTLTVKRAGQFALSEVTRVHVTRGHKEFEF
jgi:hypothetical protein